MSDPWVLPRILLANPFFYFSSCKGQCLPVSLHVPGCLVLAYTRARLVSKRRSKDHVFVQELNCHRISCPPHTIKVLYICDVQFHIDSFTLCRFYHGSVYSHVGCAKSRASCGNYSWFEALNEVQALSFQLTRRKDYLPVKPSQLRSTVGLPLNSCMHAFLLKLFIAKLHNGMIYA